MHGLQARHLSSGSVTQQSLSRTSHWALRRVPCSQACLTFQGVGRGQENRNARGLRLSVLKSSPPTRQQGPLRRSSSPGRAWIASPRETAWKGPLRRFGEKRSFLSIQSFDVQLPALSNGQLKPTGVLQEDRFRGVELEPHNSL